MTKYCGHSGKWIDDDATFKCPKPNARYLYPDNFVSDQKCHEKMIAIEIGDYLTVAEDDEAKYGPEFGADGDAMTYYMSKKGTEEYLMFLFKEEQQKVSRVSVLNSLENSDGLAQARVELDSTVCGTLPDSTKPGKEYSIACEKPLVVADSVLVIQPRNLQLSFSNIDVYVYTNQFMYDRAANEEAVRLLNTYRVKHSAAELSFDFEMAMKAQEYLEVMLKNGGKFRASTLEQRFGYGECMFELTDGSGTATLEMAVEKWYSYSSYFDFITWKFTAGFESEAQMFVQTIWKSSTHVGFAIYGDYVLAWYSPTAEQLATSTTLRDNLVQSSDVPDPLSGSDDQIVKVELENA